jgi:TPR repeat protein
MNCGDTKMSATIDKAKAAIEREDYDTAMAILRPLADSGEAEAEFLMGYLYFTSATVTKSDSIAWLGRAAAKNRPEAFYYLACLGDKIDFGPPEDEVHRGCLIRAAELGFAKAQRDLGCNYTTGEGGFSKDEALGRLWYGRAAEQGHADAEFNYGIMVIHGEGGPADPQAGMEWVRLAAKHGDGGAIHFLSQID